MNQPNQIILNQFCPRDYQLPLCHAFESGKYKKFLVVWPRRAGKDICALNLLLRAALRKVGTYFYIFPTFSMGRRILWDAIDISGNKILSHYVPDSIVESRNEVQMRIRLLNGSQIQILGSDNFDNTLVGTNAIGMIFSEYALQDPRAWSFSIPILKASDGWALFVSTPRGKNALWELYNVALGSDAWFCQKLSVEDTKHIDIAEIEKEIADGQMSKELARQEYYCFPAGQQVLTPTGLVNIQDIKEGSLVFSHTGRARKVLKTLSRKFSGDLMKIYSSGSYESIICTFDHPIRVYDEMRKSYSWKRAKDIKRDDWLVFPKKNIEAAPLISYSLCMLLAWYVCDGSFSKNSVQFTVNASKGQRIKDLLAMSNIEYSCSARGKVLCFSIYSTHLCEFFIQNCGSGALNKRIPFSLIIGYEDEFFEELMKGDGCNVKAGSSRKYMYVTISKSLAYQVQFLAHSINKGFSAGIIKIDARQSEIQGRKVNCKEKYTVNIYHESKNKKFIKPVKGSVIARVEDLELFNNHDGLVYNFEVQYDNSYIVGGRAVHNCDFSAMGVSGSYYGPYVDDLYRKNQITKVLWEPYLPVHTAWDIGFNDPTVIIFFQVFNNQVRLIDLYQNNKLGLDHYAKIVKEKPYVYGKHLGPFDIAVHDLSSGISRWRMMNELGITFVRYTDDPPRIQDGIEQVRRTLPKMWIDDQKCVPVVRALENYKESSNEKLGVFKGKPVHDSFSHIADAIRYLCVGLPKVMTHSDPVALDKRYKEALYGEQSNFPSFFNHTGGMPPMF